VLRAFNPGERRDPHGKWTKGGGALAAVAEAATGAKPAEAKAVPGPGDFSASAHLIPESAGNDTVAKYFHGGKWSPERAKLHDQIIGQALAGHQPQARPAATFLGGGTASGKSTLMAGQAGADQVHIDPDAIKTQLPDYQAMVKAGDPKAAAFAHEESSYLGKRIQAEAAARKLNMLVDGTGDNAYESMLKKINQAKAAGMQVVGKYVTADTNEAIRRAQARAAETGRMVPEPVIRKIHAGVSDVFGQLIKHGDLDAAELWDTNGPKPVLVGRKPLGEAWAVKDQKAWARFLAKAHE
jgi:predicted ABC-type ATPase